MDSISLLPEALKSTTAVYGLHRSCEYCKSSRRKNKNKANACTQTLIRWTEICNALGQKYVCNLCLRKDKVTMVVSSTSRKTKSDVLQNPPSGAC